jgi:hypothetical protein
MSGDPSARASSYVERLDAVWPRLARLSAAKPTSGALTDPDPNDEERWDWGQVRAHLAEFPGYWQDRLAEAMAAPRDEPPPFGRTRADAGRIEAIEADRSTPAPELWARIEPQLGRLRSTLEGFSAEDWELKVAHSTLGVMEMPAILDRFLVGHLEEHAAQLDGLLDS